MHSYLPDTIRREWLARHASREQTGPRAILAPLRFPERPESGHKGTLEPAWHRRLARYERRDR